MKETIKLLLLALPLAILVGWSWVFVIPYYFEEDVLDRAWGAVVLGTIWAIGITVASVFVVSRAYRAVHIGLPLNDERSKIIVTKAGYYSFIVSIGWWILLNTVIVSNTRTFGAPAQDQAAEALFGGLLALPVIFFVMWSLLTYLYRPEAV